MLPAGGIRASQGTFSSLFAILRYLAKKQYTKKLSPQKNVVDVSSAALTMILIPDSGVEQTKEQFLDKILFNLTSINNILRNEPLHERS